MLKARKHESLKLSCMAPVEKKRKIIKNKITRYHFLCYFPNFFANFLAKKATN